jgi:lysophospholipase L1-like esterase
MSSTNIGTDLHASYYVEIDAVIGTTLGDQLPIVQTMARTEAPADWIINLGTNDALLANEGHPTDWHKNLTALVKAVGYACVILTTVNINADNTYGTSAVAAEINNDLAFLAHVDPQHFHLLDWNALVQNPAHGDWLWVDRVHPSDLGRQKLADLYRQALTRCP